MLILVGGLFSFLTPSLAKGLPAGSPADLSCACEAGEGEAGGGSTLEDDGAGDDGPEPPPSLARRLLRICSG